MRIEFLWGLSKKQVDALFLSQSRLSSDLLLDVFWLKYREIRPEYVEDEHVEFEPTVQLLCFMDKDNYSDI